MIFIVAIFYLILTEVDALKVRPLENQGTRVTRVFKVI
jgi:hypothetical protein